MKFSAVLILGLLPLLASAAPGGNRNRGKKGGKGKGAKDPAAERPAAANNANTSDAVGNVAAGVAAKGSSGTSDPNTDLTLDPTVLATGFFQNGLANATPGQVASQTSKNNFMNFCKSHPDKPITNGLQIKTGSCNPAPMGIIAATTNMPSCKFQFPLNLDKSLKAFQPFDIKLKIKNIQTGNFVNPQTNYYAAPQVVNAQGIIIGHSHVVIEAIDSLTTTTVSDPTRFAFFKGVDTAADKDGVLTVPVSAGLPDGFYKLTSINAAMNHQPVLVAVAQHGTTEDSIYFTVGKGGFDVAGEDAAAQAKASATAATKATASAATSPAQNTAIAPVAPSLGTPASQAKSTDSKAGKKGGKKTGKKAGKKAGKKGGKKAGKKGGQPKVQKGGRSVFNQED